MLLKLPDRAYFGRVGDAEKTNLGGCGGIVGRKSSTYLYTCADHWVSPHETFNRFGIFQRADGCWCVRLAVEVSLSDCWPVLFAVFARLQVSAESECLNCIGLCLGWFFKGTDPAANEETPGGKRATRYPMKLKTAWVKPGPFLT